MTDDDASSVVVPSHSWLCQGDIFREVLIGRVGVADDRPQARVERGPALLVTADCVLDKKNRRGRSTVQYLNFVPLQQVSALNSDIAGNLRASAGKLAPYGSLFLPQVPRLGEVHAPLGQVYTLPAVLLRTEAHEYTEEETGEPDDRGSNTRLRATVGDTRVGRLSDPARELLWRKWGTYFMGIDPLPPAEDPP